MTKERRTNYEARGTISDAMAPKLESAFSHAIDVRFRDCDALGHVNNAVYFTFFEQARLSWWREVFGFGDIRKTGMIVARAECDFRAQVSFGATIAVHVGVARIGRSSFDLAYEIVEPRTRRLIAQGRSVQVVYDYDAQRPVPIPDELRARLERFFVNVGAGGGARSS